MAARNDWWRLSTNLILANLEAQRVIGLRLLTLAQGGAQADREARRMIWEKVAASVEATGAAAMGKSPHSILRRTRTIMRANEKRLRKNTR